MQYWSTPKKLIALFGAVGVIALALLLIVKPMLSSETVTTKPESTADSTIDPSAELQKPTEEVKLSDVDAENFSESQEVYFTYLSQISQSVGALVKTSTDLSALSAKIAKDPSDKSSKKESDALAKKLKQDAAILIALEVDAAVQKAHDTIVTEAKNIILASDAIVANFGDYEEYEKALKQFGQAFEKIVTIQGDYLAKIEKTTPQATKVASNDPNIDSAPVE